MVNKKMRNKVLAAAAVGAAVIGIGAQASAFSIGVISWYTQYAPDSWDSGTDYGSGFNQVTYDAWLNWAGTVATLQTSWVSGSYQYALTSYCWNGSQTNVGPSTVSWAVTRTAACAGSWDTVQYAWWGVDSAG